MKYISFVHTLLAVLILPALLYHGSLSRKGGLKIHPAAKADSGQNENIHSRFGENIFIFEPSMEMDDIQLLIDTLFARQALKSSEFNQNRYALLFKPGRYTLDIRVGYYMQVAGVGISPEDVTIVGAVRSNSISKHHQLTNFWRSVENLTIEPTMDSTNIWGVSQAAPIRRVHVKGNLYLHDKGYASGGFMADTKVDGTVSFGPQQQWYSRNCEWKDCRKGVWNILSMGVEGAPETNWPEGPYTSLPEVPASREKPFLSFIKGRYKVILPKSRLKSTGISWSEGLSDNRILDLDKFYIARPQKDHSASLNNALKEGKHLLFNPGIYELEESIKIVHPGTIIMGLGMPSLVSKNGNPILEIGDFGGIILSGLLLDAGKKESQLLLRLGESGSSLDHSGDPIWLFDIFCRIGGPAEGSVKNCVVINSNDVFIDHIWLWRADHGNGVGWDQNLCTSGLVVNGDRVTVYGLFNEHNQGYQTQWNGEEGRVYLYQSEMPYDPPSSESWKHGATYGFASYKVADHVTSHEAWGIGVYCVFFDAPIIVDNAIETPASLENDLHHKFTVWLGGDEGSILRSIINGKGDRVYKDNRRANLK
jgi:hypothetical protein